MEEALARIADALERMAPAPGAHADVRAHPAYLWRGTTLQSARHFAPLPLDLLTGIDAQKAALLANARRLAEGAAAHDVLLWGAKGTGKSALVKSVVGALQREGLDLALVDVAADHLDTLPALFDLLGDAGRGFILFIDDIGFEAGGADTRILRSLLEGGAEARPGNARLHVTSNRRHIVARDIDEQSSAINPRDVVDDRLALADRFGLSLGFHALDQETYLAIVARYADAYALPFDAADALLWATARGARSGRVAWHYVTELAGRAGRSL
ncbi:ATP-binding protein [Sphingomonas sp. ID1715]|uniref:ATP-binding protein n=1 Tax=Sphingomonas sp. ID1715 TaxID=1656898 RepID=UPI001488B3D0|nr:ATP-binding protein [Sphingomonas sp. ID1715]NNM77543.1 ATP-binding protein [Sphingomonas sp. ID1715]